MNTIFSKRNKITKLTAQDIETWSGYATQQVLPLSIGIKEDAEWQFPIEPMISVWGKNNVVMRSVAKPRYRGTIKERWTQDDWRISIEGQFIHTDLYTYPEDDVQRFMLYMQQPTALYVKCELLQLIGVSQIAVESYSLPFTKGDNVQNFTVEAVSDDFYELFIANS